MPISWESEGLFLVRVYFFPQKTIRLMAVLGVTMLFVAGFVYCSYGKLLLATKVEEPIYQGNTGQKVVALAFNVDWGEEYLPDILKILAAEKAKASFFVTGKWANKHPELLKDIHEKGHCIGNHGYRHAHPNNLSAEGIAKEITGAEEIIARVTGEKPTLFAPPFGEFNSVVQRVVCEHGYKLIMWSLDTIDWQRPDPGTIVNRVVPRIHNDAIILVHPTQPTVEALPQILKELKKEGYRFVTVAEIIQGPPDQDQDKKQQEQR